MFSIFFLGETIGKSILERSMNNIIDCSCIHRFFPPNCQEQKIYFSTGNRWSNLQIDQQRMNKRFHKMIVDQNDFFSPSTAENKWNLINWMILQSIRLENQTDATDRLDHGSIYSNQMNRSLDKKLKNIESNGNAPCHSLNSTRRTTTTNSNFDRTIKLSEFIESPWSKKLFIKQISIESFVRNFFVRTVKMRFVFFFE